MNSGTPPGLLLLLSSAFETPSKVRTVLPADSDVLLLLFIFLLLGWVVILKWFPQLLKEFSLPLIEKENDFSRIIHINRAVLIGFVLVTLFIFAFYLALFFSTILYRSILQPKHIIELSLLFYVPLLLYVIFKCLANYLFSWIFHSHERFKYWLQGFSGGYLLAAMALLPFLFLSLFLYGSELKILLIILPVIPVVVVTAGAVKSYFIFFGRINGCLHFILYLCAQEICPLLLLGKTLDILYNRYI